MYPRTFPGAPVSLLRPPHESEVHSTLANPYVAKFKASSKHSAAASTHGAGRPCSAQLPRWPPGTPARPARPPESRSRRGFQKRRSSVKDEGGALGLLIDGAKKIRFRQVQASRALEVCKWQVASFIFAWASSYKAFAWHHHPSSRHHQKGGLGICQAFFQKAAG